MAFQFNRLVGDHLKLRVAAALLIFQAFGQHAQIFAGIVTDDHNHRFLAGGIGIDVHIVRLGTQLTALVGHVRGQRETEFAIHQAHRLTGGVAFC